MILSLPFFIYSTSKILVRIYHNLSDSFFQECTVLPHVDVFISWTISFFVIGFKPPLHPRFVVYASSCSIMNEH